MTDTLWVAIDDFGDGVPAAGPFDSHTETCEWIGDEDGYEPRELRREVALAGLAETRRQATEQHETWLIGPDGPVGVLLAQQFGRLPVEVRRHAWAACRAVVVQYGKDVEQGHYDDEREDQ